jgi:Spy/CpxP family protein refolding chaperone
MEGEAMKEATQGRRRFFRRAGMFAALGGIAGAIGTGAYAHGGWRHGGPLTEAKLERMLRHLYVEIDATDAQKQQLEPILKQAARDVLPLREELHAGRREAIALLSQGRVDPAALEALRAKHIRLADEASRRLTRAIAEAADVLTPEQRKELAARFARRHG